MTINAFARTAPRNPRAIARFEEGPSLASLGMMLDTISAHQARTAKINALLADSFECTRLYVATRDSAVWARSMAIGAELNELGINLD